MYVRTYGRTRALLRSPAGRRVRGGPPAALVACSVAFSFAGAMPSAWVSPVTTHEETRPTTSAQRRPRGYFALYKFMFRNWGSTILRVVDGRSTLHGLGDGGNDVDELATSSECIAVISALFAGTFYSPLEQASSKAT